MIRLQGQVVNLPQAPLILKHAAKNLTQGIARNVTGKTFGLILTRESHTGVLQILEQMHAANQSTAKSSKWTFFFSIGPVTILIIFRRYLY
jgi:hypothetical protein